MRLPLLDQQLSTLMRPRVARLRELEARVRDLEPLLGRKTLDVEVLQEALAVARVKKATWSLPSPPAASSR